MTKPENQNIVATESPRPFALPPDQTPPPETPIPSIGNKTTTVKTERIEARNLRNRRLSAVHFAAANIQTDEAETESNPTFMRDRQDLTPDMESSTDRSEEGKEKEVIQETYKSFSTYTDKPEDELLTDESETDDEMDATMQAVMGVEAYDDTQTATERVRNILDWSTHQKRLTKAHKSKVMTTAQAAKWLESQEETSTTKELRAAARKKGQHVRAAARDVLASAKSQGQSGPGAVRDEDRPDSRILQQHRSGHVA
eukprot:TRINITY_DN1317_c0_g1_i13.p1 TRINITY_DN1317_c0_g1~~TRINITY_DN1317_c0_g1_i13.p1  ORF type:complete len:256 (-),score=25.54 TRINITY_DN1317_c0_g1_i13:1049-1816(-)